MSKYNQLSVGKLGVVIESFKIVSLEENLSIST